MKYLKFLLITILFMGGLFLCASLYADEANRSDVRAIESSSQMDEAAQEAWRLYEYRIGEYDKLFESDKISLEEFMKYKAAALERAENMARGTATSRAGMADLGGPNDGAPIAPDGTPIGTTVEKPSKQQKPPPTNEPELNP